MRRDRLGETCMNGREILNCILDNKIVMMGN
jgi:hypothetical protein